MNTARIAALLRELADELDPPAAATPKRRAKRKKRALPFPPPPPGPAPTELDRQRARKMLRRRGIF